MGKPWRMFTVMVVNERPLALGLGDRCQGPYTLGVCVRTPNFPTMD
jgi:hypothetical protein